MTIILKNNKEEVLKLIASFLWDADVIKSLGEPIIYQNNSDFIFAVENDKVIGFCCFYYKQDCQFLNYCYIVPEKRQKGIFKQIFAEFEQHIVNVKVKLIATKQSRDIFKKYGFTETKAFTNYFKMEKQY